ncbi:MAG: hypothetical protein KKH45_01185, partial [Proteobacteria bacterium]|nr:hypothetical protein [Pseudomonadota bacterium]
TTIDAAVSSQDVSIPSIIIINNYSGCQVHGSRFTVGCLDTYLLHVTIIFYDLLDSYNESWLCLCTLYNILFILSDSFSNGILIRPLSRKARH